jgi:uncharacterized small protein (DUF1192 family)
MVCRRFGLLASCAALALVLWGSPAVAQSGSEGDRKEKDRIEQLEKEVEALKEEVRRLAAEGAGKGTAGAVPTEPAAPAAPATEAAQLEELARRIDVLAQEIERLKIGEAAAIADQSERGFGPAASKVYRSERGLSIGGYGEALYQHFSGGGGAGEEEEEGEEEEGGSGGDRLDLLRAVLYFGYKWNDHWLFNSEIEYEHGGEEVGVEFAYLDYLWRPQANFRAGMVLLPVGFLNELHEPTVFLGARRPEVEQRILPTTWHENGFGLFGDAGPFTYRTYVVNGFDASGFSAAGLRGGRQGGAEAQAEDLAWVGRLDYTGAPGLLVGGSAYLGDSGQSLEDPAERRIGASTRLVEGHLEWRYRGLELRALGVQARLADVARLNAALGLAGEESVGERMSGHYVQAGYDLFASLFPNRGGESALIPYARWESFNTQDRVPAGFAADPENEVDVLTLGLAWKPMDQVILKLDHQSFDNPEGTGHDQVNVLLGYIF